MFRKKLATVMLGLLVAGTFLSCSKEHLKVEKSKVRFVFLGDTRGNYKAKVPEYFRGKELAQFVDQILSMNPRPQFVIFNGDMVAKSAYTKSPKSIDDFNRVFSDPLMKAGIKVYMTPGNHILDQKKGNKSINASNYIKRFNKGFHNNNPRNGPGMFKGVTYSFNAGGVHFVTTTSFVSHRGRDNTEIKSSQFVQKKKDFEYQINRQNRAWLAKDLRRDKSAHKVFFSHVALYPVGPHYKDKKALHAFEKYRDKVTGILVKNKVGLVLASHEHLYARASLSGKNPAGSKIKGSFMEVVVGAAGAPVSGKKARKDMKMEKYLHNYQLLVGDITPSGIVCNVYDEDVKNVDSFTINSK